MIKTFFLLSIFFGQVAYGQDYPAQGFHQSVNDKEINPSRNLSFFGDMLLKYQTGGKIFSSPLVSNGLLYIGSEDGNLYAINARNNKLAWKFSTGGAVHSSPVAYRNVIFFGSYDGYFYAVDAKSGKLQWKYKTGGEKRAGAKGLWTMKPVEQFMEDPFDFFLSSPVIDAKEGIIYFGSGDNCVYALHANNGKLLWKFKTGGIVHSSPALYQGTIFIGSWDQYLYAIDAKTGTEKWKYKTNADTAYHLLEGIQASPAIYNNIVYFGARDGYFYALNPETGSVKWKYSANNSWILTTPGFRDNTVYIGTSDSYQFLALDAETGKEKFAIPANGYIYSSPLIEGNRAFFGDFSGQLFAVDLRAPGKILDKYITIGRKLHAGRVLLKDRIDFTTAAKGMDLSLYSSTIAGMHNLYSLGPIVSSPVISHRVIYFGSADGYIYGLQLQENK